MDEETVSKVVGPDLLDVWHFQKLLSSVSTFYCPNQKCSTAIEVSPDAEVAETKCPACKIGMCLRCKALWHEGLSCEEAKLVPEPSSIRDSTTKARKRESLEGLPSMQDPGRESLRL
ncbi:hypothetical protein FRB99_001955 [Tulasnella sp. 403]|nr:hypothetical protein FRB99_001955 [Tulasnella sp. 403]